MWWDALARWSTILPTLGLFGLLGVSILKTRRSGDNGFDTGRLRTWGLALAVALLAATVLRSVCQTVNAFGLTGLDLDNWRTVAFESRWGSRWRWQPLAAGLTIVAWALSSWRAWPTRALVWLATIAVAVTLPLTGHAFGKPWAWVTLSVHIATAGLWLGTLAMLLLLSRGRAAVSRRHQALLGLAPLAILGVVGVVATGVASSVMALPSWSALATSAYGRVLLGKIALVGVTIALGGCNHRRLRSTVSAEAGVPSLSNAFVTLELCFALAVIVLTGTLGSMSPPM